MDTNDPKKKNDVVFALVGTLRDSKFETLPHEVRRHGQRHPLDGSFERIYLLRIDNREDGQANLFHFAHCDPHAQSLLTR
jgi:hypothetical protein